LLGSRCECVCFRLSFVPTAGCPQSVCNMFSVTPAGGVIGPTDKPLPVQISVLPKREVTIKDESILQCRVIEPRRSSFVASSSMAESLQSLPTVTDAIANIPIRVSCRSFYSRHDSLSSSSILSWPEQDMKNGYTSPVQYSTIRYDGRVQRYCYH